MTTDELVSKVLKMDYPQKLDKDYCGSCPCFYYWPTVDGFKVQIHGHCWRTTGNSLIDGCKCKYNGLHIKSKLKDRKKLEKIAKAFKKQLDTQKWYSKWSIVYD